MAEYSKATNNSEINWFRLNLTKRKELDAFRNIIIDKVTEFNKNEIADDEEICVGCNTRSYLFPSNNSNVDGYYESIMSNIKFSCWVRCSKDELSEIINALNDHNIGADASRKSNSGVIRIADENEVNALRWIINYAPKNLFRANAVPSDIKPATLSVPGGVVLEGGLSKMRGKVETDKFFFSVMDTDLFMIITKGTADEAIDLSQQIENAKKAKNSDKINNERNWMVLRASHGLEQHLDDKLLRWKDDNKDSDVYLETYLPMYLKDVKKNDKIVGQRKALYCPGYLFIRTSVTDLLKIETSKLWDGAPISRFLVRESMRKKEMPSQALTIPTSIMDDFKFAVDSNLGNIALDSDDYIDNEYVRFYKPGDIFNQRIGKILHKKDKLYLSFLPIGSMPVTKAIQVESSQIRKLTNKEKAELNIKR